MSKTERITDTEPATQDNEVVDFAAALDIYWHEIDSQQTNCGEEAELSDEEYARQCEEEEKELWKLPPFENYAGRWMTDDDYEDERRAVARGERSPLRAFEELMMPRAEYEVAMAKYASPENRMTFGRLILQHFHENVGIFYDPRTCEFSAYPVVVRFPYPVLLVDEGPWDDLICETSHYRQGVTVQPNDWMDDDNVNVCIQEFELIDFDMCPIVLYY